MSAFPRLFAFLFFALICLLITRARDQRIRRRLVLFLTAFFVIVQLALGLTQNDAWPFTPYRFMHGIARLNVESWRIGFFGVDSKGREWRVDTYAWEPLADWDLQIFFETKYRGFNDAQKRIVLQHLYKLAELDRCRIEQHGGLPNRFLAAPQLWMFPREAAAPRERYRAFRVYREAWLASWRLDDPKRENRELVGEYVAQ